MTTLLAGVDQDLTVFGPRLEAVPGASVLLPSGAASALEPFTGTLVISETRLGTTSQAIEMDARLNKDPLFFPAVRLRFNTAGNDLLPATQETIRAGSLPGEAGYWDVKVASGKVWSDPKEAGWSRATFPFSLISPSGETASQGRATFLYRKGEVGPVRYKLFSIPSENGKSFAAAGVLTARLERAIFALPEN